MIGLQHGGSVAVFIGVQKSGLQGRRSIPLFNLTQSIADRPAGATVSDRTLRKLGYSVPMPARQQGGAS